MEGRDGRVVQHTPTASGTRNQHRSLAARAPLGADAAVDYGAQRPSSTETERQMRGQRARNAPSEDRACNHPWPNKKNESKKGCCGRKRAELRNLLHGGGPHTSLLIPCASAKMLAHIVRFCSLKFWCRFPARQIFMSSTRFAPCKSFLSWNLYLHL